MEEVYNMLIKIFFGVLLGGLFITVISIFILNSECYNKKRNTISKNSICPI